MTPKEKAEELVYKCDETLEFSTPQRFARKCALIAVDEILKSGIEIDYYFDKSIGYYLSYLEYYEEVKSEIEKL
jgi:orotate phosphoribosyltransferase